MDYELTPYQQLQKIRNEIYNKGKEMGDNVLKNANDKLSERELLRDINISNGIMKAVKMLDEAIVSL